MVCVICMWGVEVGLLQVIPSFASWLVISLPEIPVRALNICKLCCVWSKESGGL